MGITFSHLLPGFTRVAATVVAQWYPAGSGAIRNAIVLLLSFILLGVAVAVFLRFIKQKGKQLPQKGRAKVSQMLQTLEQAIEEGHTSLDLDVAASPNTHEEIPSPLADLALQFDKALPKPKTKQDEIAQSALNGANGTNHTNGNVFAHPPANSARESTAPVSLPRLSELRGMRFSQALRELDKAKRSAPLSAGPHPINGSINLSLNDALADRHDDTPNEALNDLFNDPINATLMSAIAPFEPMFAPKASAPEPQNGATAMNNNGAQERRSQQAFFPPKPAPPANNRGRRREDSARSPLEPKAPEKETDGFLDQLQVLPSRRGQYKKKG